MSENKNQNYEQLVSTPFSPKQPPPDDNDQNLIQLQFQPQKLSYWQTNKALIRIIILILVIVIASVFLQKISSINYFHPKKIRQVNLLSENLPIMNKIRANKLSELLNIKKLKSFVQETKYYDVQYFLGTTKHGNGFQVLNQGSKKLPNDALHERQLLQFSMDFQEIELLINKMMHPDYRSKNPPVSLFYQSASPEQLNIAYFYHELQKYPDRATYQQAQFYRLDKLYNIGIYKKQLPLCVVFTGRDNQQFIRNAYQSIMRQNYTNYRVVHVDDNSDQSITNKAIHLLEQDEKYSEKFTLIRQNRQRNELFNINFAIKNYCQPNDIILELKPSGSFIGRQAFQLINSLYQAGYIYKGSRNDLWATIMKTLIIPQNCCPELKPPHNIQRQLIESGTVREKNDQKIYNFRTYLIELYQKIDQGDFIDKISTIPQQFYSDSAQLYTFIPIIQMSGIDHLRLLGQAIVYEQLYSEQKKSVQTKYTIKTPRFIKKYSKIKNLTDIIERKQGKIDQKQKKQLQELGKQLEKKRKDLVKNFIDIANNKFITSIKKSKQEYIKQIQQRKVFYPQNEGKQFGYDEKFFIDVKRLNQQGEDSSFYEQYGIQDAIQVGSKYDYLNLSQVVNFTEVKKKFIQTVAHQLLTFKFDQSLQLKGQKIKYTHFKSQLQIESFLKQVEVVYLDKNVINDTDYLVSEYLARMPEDQSAKQLQYYHLDKKYNIGSLDQQIPICVFSSGYKLFTNDRYKTYFSSYQRLNYTNFKIVWVDDYSDDYSAYQVYNYLKNSNMRLKNRIKIIYNLQHLGILANMHIYIQKYCGPDDVVIICDADDGIAGIQTFHILNSLYRDPKNCYVYSRFLMNDDNYRKNTFFIGPSSKPFNIAAEKYRVTQTYWVTSHLRTFRKKVMDAVPLEHFIQYHQDRKKGIAWPRYYGSSADRFQIYTHVQICGNSGVKFITDFMLNYQIRPQAKCYRYHQLYDEYKSRIKIPLKPLSNLDLVPEYFQNYESPKQIFERLKKQYIPHKECLLAAQTNKK